MILSDPKTRPVRWEVEEAKAKAKSVLPSAEQIAAECALIETEQRQKFTFLGPRSDPPNSVQHELS